MRTIVRKILILGLLIIVGLSLYFFYHTYQIKNKMQISLNTFMEQYSHEGSNRNIRIFFKPFECRGLLSLQCVSREIRIYKNQKFIFSFSNLNFSLNNIRNQELTLNFTADTNFKKDAGLSSCVDAVFPKQIWFETHLSLLNQTFFVNSTFVLKANNMDYRGKIGMSVLQSESTRSNLFANFKTLGENGGIFLNFFEVSLFYKNLNDALCEISQEKDNEFKKQECEIFLDDLYKIFVFQDKKDENIVFVSDGVKNLVSGKIEQLKISVQVENEFCLTCLENEDIMNMLKSLHIKVEQQ